MGVSDAAVAQAAGCSARSVGRHRADHAPVREPLTRHRAVETNAITAVVVPSVAPAAVAIEVPTHEGPRADVLARVTRQLEHLDTFLSEPEERHPAVDVDYRKLLLATAREVRASLDGIHRIQEIERKHEEERVERAFRSAAFVAFWGHVLAVLERYPDARAEIQSAFPPEAS